MERGLQFVRTMSHNIVLHLFIFLFTGTLDRNGYSENCSIECFRHKYASRTRVTIHRFNLTCKVDRGSVVEAALPDEWNVGSSTPRDRKRATTSSSIGS